MYHATFTLECVTPIFMRGANQGKAEIRASSIKGLMRWWFRALAHGVLLGNSTENEAIKKIKSEENKIFGSTEEKSKFILHVATEQLKEVKVPKSYFNFGVGEYGLIGTFDIKLQIFDPKYRDIILATFLPFGILGSIGQRNRRALGSIAIQSSIASDIAIRIPFDYTPKEISSLLNWSIQIFEDHFRVKLKEDVQTKPWFPAVHPKFFRIKVGTEQYSDWKSAILELSRILRDFRENKRNRHTRTIRGKRIPYYVTKQYDSVKKAMDGETDVDLPYSAFGLPHQYNFFSMDVKGIVIEGEKHTRRASPLAFKICKFSKSTYVPMITFLDYIFLPDNENLQIRYKKLIKAKGIRQPSLNAVRDFFETFDGEEVKWGVFE